jgi:ABC-type branched-subunit amino acid transport system ATPase component
MFENIYFFCKRLSELPNTSVYERIQAVAEASCENIEKEASREDIFQYFPKAKYFRDQLDKRESTKKGVQPILSDANTDP